MTKINNSKYEYRLFMKKKMASFLILFVIIFCTHSINAQSENCLKYEPSVVNVKGKLVYKYYLDKRLENNNNVKVIVLELYKPICTEPTSSVDEINEHEEDVLFLQVVYTNEQQHSILIKNIDKNVVIEGTLYHSHTGHHFEKVLIILKSIIIE